MNLINVKGRLKYSLEQEQGSITHQEDEWKVEALKWIEAKIDVIRMRDFALISKSWQVAKTRGTRGQLY